MDRLLPANLREHFALSVRLYDDGSALVAVRVGPSDSVAEFETGVLCPAPGGLIEATELACALVGIWGDSGVLGLASEAPG